MAAAKGTELHEFAAFAIRLGQKLPRTNQTINLFVNDAIGYGMTPEQILFYSNNAFGTTDAISFRHNILRIHDLKTGVIEAKFDQLIIYAAFFCLEYDIAPASIKKIELRIYQNDEVKEYEPELEEIVYAMDRIVTFDRLIENLKDEIND